MKRHLAMLLLFPALLAAMAAPASAQTPPAPTPVVVVNTTRFQPLAQDATIPAGESMSFQVESDHFSRASLLIAGSMTPGAGAVRLATLFGPPLVPSGPPRRLPAGRNGLIRDRLIEPVLGPAMVVVVTNDSTAPVTLSLSAYLSN